MLRAGHYDLTARYLNHRPGMRRIQKYRALHAEDMVLVGCGLAFCVAFGRSAAVSFSLSAALRPVLVSSPNEATASFIPIVGSRLVYVFHFGIALVLVSRGGFVALFRYLVLVDPHENKKIKLTLFRQRPI